jgi:formamidopyrimidine-DNA glycosylase
VPELPEVETLRRDLERVAVGRRVVEVSVTGRRTVRRQPPSEFSEALTGRRIEGARRHGKYLWAPLDDRRALVVHLRMSGQLLHFAPGAAAPLAEHTHAVLRLDDGAELRFVDPRTFGELFVTGDLDPTGRPRPLASLGRDPLVDGIDPSRMRRMLAGRRTSLKAFLLDQHQLAGIGNLYADEVCFRARLRPDRRTDGLDARQAARLSRAVTEVLSEAVAARGSTLSDGRYLDLCGGPGGFQHRHAVYGRAGEPCPRCGMPVERSRVAGRSAHYCPSCQG